MNLHLRIARQARSAWPRIAALLAVGLLASPLALLAPLPLKIAVDGVLGGHPLPSFLDGLVPHAVTSSPTSLLAVAAGLAVAITVLGQLQSLAQKYLTSAAGERLVLEFRATMFRHLQRLSLSYHDSTGSADSVYRVQSDAPALQKIVIEGLIPTISAAATLAAMLFVMVRLDWQLALVALAVSPPLYLAARRYRPRLRRQSREVRKIESGAMAVVQEVLGALRVVKAFGQEEREAERYVRRSDEGVRGRMRLVLAEGRLSFIVGVVTALGTAAVLFIGIDHVRSGLLSMGDLLLLMGYVGKLYDPMKTISRKAATLEGHLASVERAFAILDQQPDVVERPDARPVGRARGAVAFRGVSFSYGGHRPVLHGISFEVGPETHLGIAGATGAGKSTLISLLTRLYDPTEGRVLLDGVDVRDYRLDDLRRQFAVVLQDPVLFSATIAENIAYAEPGASRERIVAAARAANADEFIERLSRGYDTEVGERGVKLSGGQRQRIALARAFLKDSPVLILDEPTSALDVQTEATIVEALERLKRGRTVIVISHRSSALAGCSEVLVIDRGRLAGDTTRMLAERSPMPPPHRPERASGKHRENLLAHPAVQAWRGLRPDLPVPTRIAPAKLKPYKRRTAVYRLDDVGPDGGAVIAKRCRRADAVIERAVYEDFLPHLPIPAAGYVGCIDDAGEEFTWLFTQEVDGEEYLPHDATHRAYAARWIGALHAGAAAIGRHPTVPQADPRRYLEHLRAARDLMGTHRDNPVLTTEDVAFLDAVMARFDELEARWDWLEGMCADAPQTLVHGDFNGKNLRVRTAGPTPGIIVFDWEDAGWGPPAVDLAQMAVPASRIAAGPDLATYWDAAREGWAGRDRASVERIASCGTVFRALATLDWESHNLAFEWAQWFLGSIRLFEAELSHALGRLGWMRARARPTAETLGV